MKVGDKLPEFKLPDQDWNELNSEDLVGSPTVIFFYPKDETPGCVKQVCSFRDQFEEFKEQGVEVIGVSNDSPEDHRNFQTRLRLPFRLLSDKKGELRKKFDVPSNLMGLLPGRVTYVFDDEGILRHKFQSQLKYSQHVDEALTILKKLN